MRTAKKRRSLPYLRITLVVVVIVLAGCAGVAYKHHLDSNHQAKTTSKSPTAQSTYSGGQPRQTSSGSASEGGAIDQKGQSSTPPPSTQSQWKTSASGNITLQVPASNDLLTSGDVVEGTAKVPVVQFRLVDTQAGVIAQGSLSVVNGGFSGKLEFHALSSSGKLDIFSYDSAGTEINSISIPVRFSE